MSVNYYQNGPANTKAAVTHIQKLLNAKGALPQLDADGVFGEDTKAAVLAFQGAVWGVGSADQDGIVGPETLGALSAPSTSNYQMYYAPAAATKAIQELLVRKGVQINDDAVFGPATRAAVIAFQGVNGLPGSGIVTPATLTLLKGDGKSVPVSTSAGAGQPTGWVATQPIDPHTVTFNKYTDAGDIASWVAAGLALRGITDPAAVANWTAGFTTAAGRESSGNPNACNTNDLNNVTPDGYSQVQDWGEAYPASGDPYWLDGALTNFQCSRGMMQDIPQTFAAYWCPGSTVNIYDAPSGVAATVGYLVGNYGVALDGSDLAEKVQQFDPSRSPQGY